ncbi:hypothetical protein GCM10023321_66830 [Pseudonocardia eucalypti]|uniref:GPP34 family phosphoprotein n=1 Tax=Pseudonocardia eucalypti TaxID=648755 RepID=A0ABP9R114_9PSEU|nr:hypothetical protein [Pseudonocardia eucalypti]
MTQLIAEELLLLVYRLDGTAYGKTMELDKALGGALLIELALDGRVDLVDKRLRPAAETAQRPAHPELDQALALVEAKPRLPKQLVDKLSVGVRRRLSLGLVEAGVLTDESSRVLGIFPWRRYPVADPAPREDALRRLRAVVIEGAEPDPRTAALATLILAAGFTKRIFPGEDQRAVKARLRELAKGDWAAEAVRKAVQAAQGAMMAAAAGAAAAGAAGS